METIDLLINRRFRERGKQFTYSSHWSSKCL